MASLRKLRSVMKLHRIDGFIVPTRDAHNSEYIASQDKRREFITGFNGSAGTAVVTNDKAALWVDGRYWITAETQVDLKQWAIIRAGQKGQPTITEWLNESLNNERFVVAIDPFLTSTRDFKKWQKELTAELTALKTNPIDEIWEEKPSAQCTEIFLHETRHAGTTANEKLDRLRKHLKENGSNSTVITALDEIAWILNLRGADIDYNPVFISYLAVCQDSATLFVDAKKINGEIARYLSHLGVNVEPYENIVMHCETMNKNLSQKELKKVSLNEHSNYAIYRSFLPEHIHEENSPVEIFKAVKNNAEIGGMRNSHTRDGAAKTAWIAWLKEEVDGGNGNLTELSVAAKLAEYRSKQKDFVSLSFESISSVGSNAAIIHYSPTTESDTKIDPNQIYLIDSGGQYKDGTTDVTRTLHFGKPKEIEKKYFTLVLKGHIALAKAEFPVGTSGSLIDVLARQFLWKEGGDYRHGTGHGVGSFLNVHEGPVYISPGRVLSPGLEEGMVLSNEPGYYRKGEFGIRIESVIIAKKIEGDFLAFETVTMIPLERKLIALELMTVEEIEWVDSYHREVKERIGPLLQSDERAMRFLEESCAPLVFK